MKENEEERTDKGLFGVEDIFRDRSRTAISLRKEGAKIIGYLCCSPVELITAAGFVPYRIKGDMTKSVTKADAYIETIYCPFVRSAFDIAIQGGYDFLDGFVVPHGCDNTERIYEVWGHNIKPEFSHFINVPHTVSDQSVEFLTSELRNFKMHLEQCSGMEIPDSSIRDAIRDHNRNRALIRELYELRKSDPPCLSGSEMLKVVTANMSLPVVRSNSMLENLLEGIRGRKRGTVERKHRILIYGSELDDPAFMEMLEKLGADVVIDSICFGTRPYLHDVPVTEDPLAGLARHYLRDISCPRTWMDGGASREEDLKNRFGYLLDFARDWNASAAIMYVIRYCDNMAFDVPDVKDYLERSGIKVFPIHNDYSLVGMAQLRTRVQAFLEMLG